MAEQPVPLLLPTNGFKYITVENTATATTKIEIVPTIPEKDNEYIDDDWVIESGLSACNRFCIVINKTNDGLKIGTTNRFYNNNLSYTWTFDKEGHIYNKIYNKYIWAGNGNVDLTEDINTATRFLLIKNEENTDYVTICHWSGKTRYQEAVYNLTISIDQFTSYSETVNGFVESNSLLKSSQEYFANSQNSSDCTTENANKNVLYFMNGARKNVSLWRIYKRQPNKSNDIRPYNKTIDPDCIIVELQNVSTLKNTYNNTHSNGHRYRLMGERSTAASPPTGGSGQVKAEPAILYKNNDCDYAAQNIELKDLLPDQWANAGNSKFNSNYFFRMGINRATYLGACGAGSAYQTFTIHNSDKPKSLPASGVNEYNFIGAYNKTDNDGEHNEGHSSIFYMVKNSDKIYSLRRPGEYIVSNNVNKEIRIGIENDIGLRPMKFDIYDVKQITTGGFKMLSPSSDTSVTLCIPNVFNENIKFIPVLPNYNFTMLWADAVNDYSIIFSKPFPKNYRGFDNETTTYDSTATRYGYGNEAYCLALRLNNGVVDTTSITNLTVNEVITNTNTNSDNKKRAAFMLYGSSSSNDASDYKIGIRYNEIIYYLKYTKYSDTATLTTVYDEEGTSFKFNNTEINRNLTELKGRKLKISTDTAGTNMEKIVANGEYKVGCIDGPNGKIVDCNTGGTLWYYNLNFHRINENNSVKTLHADYSKQRNLPANTDITASSISTSDASRAESDIIAMDKEGHLFIGGNTNKKLCIEYHKKNLFYLKDNGNCTTRFHLHFHPDLLNLNNDAYIVADVAPTDILAGWGYGIPNMSANISGVGANDNNGYAISGVIRNHDNFKLYFDQSKRILSRSNGVQGIGKMQTVFMKRFGTLMATTNDSTLANTVDIEEHLVNGVTKKYMFCWDGNEKYYFVMTNTGDNKGRIKLNYGKIYRYTGIGSQQQWDTETPNNIVATSIKIETNIDNIINSDLKGLNEGFIVDYTDRFKCLVSTSPYPRYTKFCLNDNSYKFKYYEATGKIQSLSNVCTEVECSNGTCSCKNGQTTTGCMGTDGMYPCPNDGSGNFTNYTTWYMPAGTQYLKNSDDPSKCLQVGTKQYSAGGYGEMPKMVPCNYSNDSTKTTVHKTDEMNSATAASNLLETRTSVKTFIYNDTYGYKGCMKENDSNINGNSYARKLNAYQDQTTCDSNKLIYDSNDKLLKIPGPPGQPSCCLKPSTENENSNVYAVCAIDCKNNGDNAENNNSKDIAATYRKWTVLSDGKIRYISSNGTLDLCLSVSGQHDDNNSKLVKCSSSLADVIQRTGNFFSSYGLFEWLKDKNNPHDGLSIYSVTNGVKRYLYFAAPCESRTSCTSHSMNVSNCGGHCPSCADTYGAGHRLKGSATTTIYRDKNDDDKNFDNFTRYEMVISYDGTPEKDGRLRIKILASPAGGKNEEQRRYLFGLRPGEGHNPWCNTSIYDTSNKANFYSDVHFRGMADEYYYDKKSDNSGTWNNACSNNKGFWGSGEASSWIVDSENRIRTFNCQFNGGGNQYYLLCHDDVFKLYPHYGSKFYVEVKH